MTHRSSSRSRSTRAPAPTTGPTVVVAHSVGGLAARLYVATYPDDIVGLVLVDATSIGIQDLETPEQWEIQRKLLAGDISESLAEYPDIEQLDFDASFAQVRAAGPVPATEAATCPSPPSDAVVLARCGLVCLASRGGRFPSIQAATITVSGRPVPEPFRPGCRWCAMGRRCLVIGMWRPFMS
jgi:pimeloyl-ACP methyl ester carboxylesterase